MRAAIILGTRPEIIKLAPAMRALKRKEYILVHTEQHYDYEMNRIFLEELGLPEPDYNLHVGSGTQAVQTGKAMMKIEEVLMTEKPDVTIVQGDTNTVLAGALASVKLHIPVAHVEAGLRSNDRMMPEEINRIVTDHVSDVLFPPTEKAKENLLREGIPEEWIHVVGNTVVDAVLQHSELAEKKSQILRNLGLKDREYAVVTAHRAENVDSRDNLKKIVEIIRSIPIPVVYPVHPRTEKRLKAFGLWEELEGAENIILTKPMGYFDFLKLMKHARLILTDSGGIQEEAITLHVPCITLRYTTERPETVEVGGNVLVGLEVENAKKIVERMLSDKEFEEKMRSAPNPFGDGRAGERIAEVLRNLEKEGKLKVHEKRMIE
ncbi:MAG: UDP-N-acetylglucosamine 2-epimerase (non-hydrolyzing) [Candidatus Diapherotrites archaeon]|nr:UDP-N-acetylglucosamine 2-epimerase (non-hydrolyzing) [Candidatus Diapherotrites archaeon]